MESQKSKMSRLKNLIKELIKTLILWAIVDPFIKFRKWLNRSKFIAFILGAIIAGTFAYCYLTIKYEYHDFFNSRVIVLNNSHVALAQEQVASTNEKVEAGGEEQSSPLIQIVKKYFGNNTDQAMKVIQCESQGHPDRIGDGHLAFWHEGELLGRSIGLFQIRTGGMENGKVWNRAKNYGMTVAEFEEKLKNPEFNSKVAYDIYQGSGSWDRWTCKKVLSQI